jgi:coenzyme F420 hydrogenase subunit beta
MLKRGANHCGLCFSLCPQAHPEQVNTSDFAPITATSLQAKDSKILDIASNGGFVTAFLSFLLKKNLIKAAVAVTGEKREPIGISVDSAKDVKQLAGTRYSPSGVLNSFADALRDYGNNIAVVGLPCELRGVSRMEKRLNKNVLKIGLFCSNNNRTNEDGKTEKLGSCAHCTDFFASHADIACGFAGSGKGFTTVVSLTESGDELLKKVLEANIFEMVECDQSKVKASQTRKQKRDLIQPIDTLREKIVLELENGPNEIDRLAKTLKVRSEDLIYHLLILQHNGVVKAAEKGHDHYSIEWALA